MKQLLLCLMVMVSVVKVYGASSQFYSGQTWWSDVRAIAITETTLEQDFTTLDETLTSPLEILEEEGADEDFSSPVDIVGEEDEIIEEENTADMFTGGELPTGEENAEEIENNGGTEENNGTAEEIKESQ